MNRSHSSADRQSLYSNQVTLLIMSAFDSNRDGRLDPNERQDAQEFARGDGNRDGALNINEFSRGNRR